MLEDACAYLGIDLRHARPYRPAGKGKIERFFQTCDRFNREAQALIDQGRITTLEEVQTFFAAWLQTEYNGRIHSATHERPEDRLRKVDPAYPPEMLDPDRVNYAFLWREQRKVSKAGTISVEGNEYEVDPALARKIIHVRYDPYDLTTLLVEYEGQSYGEATPLDVHRKHSARFPRKDQDGQEVAGTENRYLELLQKDAEQERMRSLGQLRFRQGAGTQGGEDR